MECGRWKLLACSSVPRFFNYILFMCYMLHVNLPLDNRVNILYSSPVLLRSFFSLKPNLTVSPFVTGGGKMDSEQPEARERSIGDFLRHSEESLAQVDNLARATELLGVMVDDRMSEKGIVNRIAHSPFADDLLQRLIEYSEEGQRRDPLNLAHALMHASAGLWESSGGNLSEELVMAWLIRRLGIREVFRVFREFLLDEEHPLFETMDPDIYWSATVQHFVERGDFRRAWDGVKKAHAGFLKLNRERPVNCDPEEVKEFLQDSDNRCCRASRACLTQIVQLLFASLVERGLIIGLQEADRMISQRETEASIPSLEFAASFGSEGSQGVFRLSETGAMVRKVARHFCDQKNAKRRGAAAAS